MFIAFSMLVRATFKLIKQRDEMLWLSTLVIANKDASDSDNGKIKYCYADLIEKEELMFQNLLKSTKTEPKKKKKKIRNLDQKKKKNELCDPCI